MEKLLCLSLLTLGTLSCQKSETLDLSPLNGSNRITFSSPVDGQTSTYVRYAFDCSKGDEAFQWTGDTLFVTYYQEDDGQSYFKEYFTASSPLLRQGLGNDTVRYRVDFRDGHLVIPDRLESALFFFYGSDSLHINYLLDFRPQLTQNGCILQHHGQSFIGDEIAMVSTFDVGPVHIRDKTVVSCVPIVFNLEAYIFYDHNELFLTHTIDDSEFNGVRTAQVAGWMLLDE